MGAIRANDFPRQANESGRAGGDHASLRTDPDDAERDTGIYGLEGRAEQLTAAEHQLRAELENGMTLADALARFGHV